MLGKRNIQGKISEEDSSKKGYHEFVTGEIRKFMKVVEDFLTF